MKKSKKMLLLGITLASQLIFINNAQQQNGSNVGSIIQALQGLYKIINPDTTTAGSTGNTTTTPQDKGGFLDIITNALKTNSTDKPTTTSTDKPTTTAKGQESAGGFLDILTNVFSNRANKEMSSTNITTTINSILAHPDAVHEKISEASVMTLLNNLNDYAQTTRTTFLPGTLGKIFEAIKNDYKENKEKQIKAGATPKEANLSFLQSLIFTLWMHNAKIEDEAAFNRLEQISVLP